MKFTYRKLLVDGRQAIGWIVGTAHVILATREGVIAGVGLLWRPQHARRLARQLRSKGRHVRVVVTREL